MPASNRSIAAAAVVSLLAIVAGGLLLVSSTPAGSTAVAARYNVLFARAPIQPPFVMFRTLAPKGAFGRVAMARPAQPAARHLTPLSCARVQWAAGVGLCVVEEAEGKTVHQLLYVFDRRFVLRTRIALAGIPIRARVSPDGRFASVTVYGEEESPNGERLASESMLIDARTGRVLGDLREFAVDNPHNLPIEQPVDISSVAFTADGDRFFATFATPSARYLASGAVSTRRLELVGAGLANEAVSPDGTRLIAKKQTGSRGHWQLVVLDLTTKGEIDLNQGPRSIDDQVEWLDDAHVIYHDVTDEGTGIWVLPTDGVGGPSLLIR